jgi:tetratricopeptide (TPR) repeat protein
MIDYTPLLTLSRGVGMSLLSLGISHHGQGQIDRAAENCESAAAVFRDISDRWSLAWGLLSFGGISLEMMRLESARQQLEEAISIFRDFGDRRSEARALMQLGRVFQMLGDNTHDREFWINALEILDSVEDPRADEIRALIQEIPDD